MYKRATLVGCLFTASVAIGIEVNGAGSSAIAPLIQAWAKEYYKETGIKVNYQAVGSGSGIRMVSQRMVDFGATDAPLKPNQLEKKNLLQFPIAAFGAVFAYNLPNVDGLKLSTRAVCGIFSGKIKYWDDPLILETNPGKTLPHIPILVVVRADKSGTTYTVTSYLVKACKEELPFKKPSKKPRWGLSNLVAAKGNAGVAAVIQKKFGTIGYVEYTYAVKGGLKVTTLQNRDGNYVKPSLESFQAALKNVHWGEGFYADLTYQPGSNTWPIVGATWALLPLEKKERNKLVAQFFHWGFSKGDEKAKELYYAPLPKDVVNKVKVTWCDSIYLYNY
ncbi:MAG TPA: phosphate ABC transporter substrate-binding protein PstS [Aquifex aeolicus]|uniref:Phosphate-binding protein n=1 Tax=Aquifex aeolicus TaxID=63363 RepID=A0A9D1CFV5_AQUAO|nr:phosphate ABC transporter substrate-binding protein PstS [Aquificales bacterium]HIP98846.1 phosphate ABC transporter substrate-binding protein PstS [Aquifex aeolicus]HIQ26534.1 phosphate ABC transporter substrate-binding protein PstS [Aquifex aeolicus]